LRLGNAIQLFDEPTYTIDAKGNWAWLGAVSSSRGSGPVRLRLKALRQKRGLQEPRVSFADALELDENRYTRYERGEVEPNLANICRICLVLGVEPNDLLNFPRGRRADPVTSGKRRRRKPTEAPKGRVAVHRHGGWLYDRIAEKRQRRRPGLER